MGFEITAMKEVEVNSSDAMVQLGANFAKQTAELRVVAIVGDLGAGKTHFTKGLLKGLGFEGQVTSPTFGLVNEYKTPCRYVCHFDFYRIKKSQELINIGWDDYLERDDLIVVEWANMFPELIPEDAVIIKIEHVEEGRLVKIH